MKSIHSLPMNHIPSGNKPARMQFLGAIVVLCATLASCPAPGQDAAPAAGGDVPHAGGGDGAESNVVASPDGMGPTNRRDIDPVTPVRSPTGLQRRANLKALIANTSARPAVGSPAGAMRAGPFLAHPGAEAAAPRNAIGVAVPGARSSGRDIAGTSIQARVTAIGTAAGGAGNALRQMPAPTNAGAAMHPGGINGTTIGRVAFGPASVGGPARERSGINGTWMRTKH